MRYEAATTAYLQGKFPSGLRSCARYHKVPFTTLYQGLVMRGGQYKGIGGRESKVLSSKEEKEIVKYINWKASIGYGVNWQMVQLLVQEVCVKVTSVNPGRVTGLEKSGQLPNMSWVRRFARRHNLVLRRTAEISKGRQVVTPAELALWQKDLQNFI